RTQPMSSLTARLQKLESTIAAARQNHDRQAYFDSWRQIVRLYDNSVCGNGSKAQIDKQEAARLREMAGRGLIALAGQSEPTLSTLDQYNHRRYGPRLGVSDEGSAAEAVRRGAFASPKCAVLGSLTPLTVGVAHDAERLGAIGEVCVGPKEYANI